MYINPLLTYSSFRAGIGDYVLLDLEPEENKGKDSEHVWGENLSDSDCNKLTLSMSIPRTCILIENNQIKPTTSIWHFQIATLSSRLEGVAYVQIRELGLIARYRLMIAVALYKNSDVITPQIVM